MTRAFSLLTAKRQPITPSRVYEFATLTLDSACYGLGERRALAAVPLQEYFMLQYEEVNPMKKKIRYVAVVEEVVSPIRPTGNSFTWVFLALAMVILARAWSKLKRIFPRVYIEWQRG